MRNHMKHIMGFSVLLLALIMLVSISRSGAVDAAGNVTANRDNVSKAVVSAPDVVYTPEMKVDAQTGLPLTLYGVDFQTTANTAEGRAYQYLAANHSVLGLSMADVENLSVRAVRDGLAGETVRWQQYEAGLPVYKGEIAIHISPEGVVNYVSNDFKYGPALNSMAPALVADGARATALEHLDATGNIRYEDNELMVVRLKGQTFLAYVVTVIPEQPAGDWEVIVDAHTGDILQVQDTRVYNGGDEAHGLPTGNIFDPDPLSSANAAYGDPGYTDGGDADTPELDAELVNVTLLDLTFDGTMYYLTGPYAEIVDFEGPFNGTFEQASSDFSFTRNQDGFEAVNVYYHLDASLRYLSETLGMPIMPYQYVGGAQGDPHAVNGADNSYYSSATGQLAWGEGGVDDAEDSDVIHHELGHGLHDWVTSGGISQVDGLSEGVGDYWAQSYNRSLGYWAPTDPAYNYVFNWDGHNEFWPGRTTAYDAPGADPDYPGGLTGSIHTDGQIWATCMMRIWSDPVWGPAGAGQQPTDTIFWEGLGMTGGSASQNDAAVAVMQAAIDLGYAANELQAIHSIFTSCGYTIPALPVSDFTLAVTPDMSMVCAGSDAVYTVDIGTLSNFMGDVSLAAVGNPGTATFGTNPVTPPGSSSLTISGAAAGNYSFDVVGTSVMTASMMHTSTVGLDVYDAAPGGTTLMMPADMATGVSPSPVFSWMAVAEAGMYHMELATDVDFANIVATASTTMTTYTPMINLDPDTTYYWRVMTENSCGMGSSSATFSFTTASVICSSPGLAIPDNEPAGGSDSIVVNETGWLEDLNVSLDVTHTWVGDLHFELTHEETGTTVTLVDRPGYTGSGFGCDGNDILATLDDDGATAIEDECADATPTIEGTFSPNSPLNAFNGEGFAGTWTLTAVDNASGDTGTINNWCLVPATLNPSLTLTKTMSLDGSCGTNSGPMSVAWFSDVTYCYMVENTGNMMLPTHTVTDTVEGVLLSGVAHDLMPGETFFFTHTVTLTPPPAPFPETISGCATWEGEDGAMWALSNESCTQLDVVAPTDVSLTAVAGENSWPLAVFAVLGLLLLAGSLVVVKRRQA
ncbi:MAG TPA: proprotein convertase P-domain-containing protein [Anaerolineae bacterium]|nr:proprotein convertase P-domain-containing protein [Anaerolineae bacterium]